jgi:hypothetical protein
MEDVKSKLEGNGEAGEEHLGKPVGKPRDTSDVEVIGSYGDETYDINTDEVYTP